MSSQLGRRSPAGQRAEADLGAPTEPAQRPDLALQSAWVWALAAIPIGVAWLSPETALLTASVAAASQLLLVRQAFVLGRPLRITIAAFVAILSFAFFGFRLLVICLDQSNLGLHPIVQSATAAELNYVAVLSTLALAGFVQGAMLVRPPDSNSIQQPQNLTLSRSQLWLIAIPGLCVTAGLEFSGIEFGGLKQVGLVFLFALGAMAFSAAVGRGSWLDPMIVALVGTVLGVASGTKEDIASPWLAIILGVVLARGIRIRGILVATVVLLCVFSAVQSERLLNTQASGSSGLVADTWYAVHNYDLATGRPVAELSPAGVVANISQGAIHRFIGSDSLLVLTSAVPEEVPFQRGQTIVEPMLSVVPGAEQVLGLTFSNLSLGRYFMLNFYSLQPTSDPSSQAITSLGDLYLNGGFAAVVLGAFVLGFLVRRMDRGWVHWGPVGAGALVYLGLSAGAVERNVAYLIVNTSIRVLVVVAIVHLLANPMPRKVANGEQS